VAWWHGDCDITTGGYRGLAEQYGGTMKKILMIVFPGMIAVLFSLNLAVAAPSNMQDSSRHLYDRVMEAGDVRDQYRGVDRGSYPSNRMFSFGIVTSF
jgi:hypothetical protein